MGKCPTSSTTSKTSWDAGDIKIKVVEAGFAIRFNLWPSDSVNTGTHGGDVLIPMVRFGKLLSRASRTKKKRRERRTKRIGRCGTYLWAAGCGWSVRGAHTLLSGEPQRILCDRSDSLWARPKTSAVAFPLFWWWRGFPFFF